MEQNLQLKFQLHYQFRILDTSTGSVRVLNFGLKGLWLIPFLCEAAPNSFKFFLSLCPSLTRRWANASFAVHFSLILKYGLAHLHTELVLVQRLIPLKRSCAALKASCITD